MKAFQILVVEIADLSNYVDGEVSAELRAALEEHVAKCRRCRVVHTGHGAFEVPLPVSARLYTRLEKAAREDIGILPGRVVS